jgi:hypothetical protein
MSMIFILIQIKFDIDINSDELLKTIWKHKKKKKNWLLLLMWSPNIIDIPFECKIRVFNSKFYITQEVEGMV